MGMTMEELEARNGRKKNRVEVQNLRAYSISFQDADKTRGHEGFLINGYEKNTTLSLDEVYGQINQAHNFAFVGTDGMGKNAPLRITDPVVRAYCFDMDQLEPLQLTDENIKKLLKIDTRAKFSEFMEELIATEGEAMEMRHRIANDRLNLSNMVSWKEQFLENHVKKILKENGRIQNR